MKPDEVVMLFTREGCHLCERVESMLESMSVQWRPVDIESDLELEEVYGLRIPVLRMPHSGHELAFPFDEDALSHFLKEQGD